MAKPLTHWPPPPVSMLGGPADVVVEGYKPGSTVVVADRSVYGTVNGHVECQVLNITTNGKSVLLQPIQPKPFRWYKPWRLVLRRKWKPCWLDYRVIVGVVEGGNGLR